MKRKFLYVLVLSVFLFSSASLWAEEREPKKMRFGLPEISGKNISPMETFLLENEIANTFVNNFSAELLRESVIRKKLVSLGLSKCDTDSCRSLLGAELNLDYLIESSFRKDAQGEYQLKLKLFQQTTGLSFVLRSQAKSFGQLKKTLPLLSQLNLSIIAQEIEKQDELKQNQKAEELEKEAQEVTKGINTFDQQLQGFKKDIAELEKKIRLVQRRLARFIKRNPELEDTYQEILKLYLPDPEKEKAADEEEY